MACSTLTLRVFLVLLGTSIVDQVFVPSFTFNSIGLIGEKGSDLEP
jgi:hypothetical protein